MAALTSAAPPWSLPFPAVQKDRIIILANTDVSWSLAVCQYYATARGIPLTNILAQSWGNGVQAGSIYNPGSAQAAWLRAESLANFRDSIGGTGFILGPGIPPMIQVPTADGSGVGTPALSQLVACCRLIRDTVSNANVRCQVGGTQNWILWDSGNLVYIPNGELSALYGITFDSAEIVCTSTDTGTIGQTLQTLYVPSQIQLQQARNIAQSGADFYPVGRLGWTAWDNLTGTPPETQASVTALIDYATCAMAVDRSVKINQPLMLMCAPISGTNQDNIFPEWVKLCQSWGLRVRYENGTNQPATDLISSPESLFNASMTKVNPPLEYWCRMGYMTNDNMWQITNYSGSYVPHALNLSGVSSFIAGPSSGHDWNIHAITTQKAAGGGAICGMTDGTHKTSSQASAVYGIWHGLLRGMPAMLAGAMQNGGYAGTSGCNLPIGDPLFAPFGRPV